MTEKTETPAFNFATGYPAAAGDNIIPDHGAGVEAIIKLAQDAAGYDLATLSTEGLGAGFPAKIPVLIDQRPNGKVTDLKDVVEKYRLTPERRKGAATVTTLKAFCDLVNRHKDTGSAIFAKTSWPAPQLTAVLDYHALDHTPRYGQHRILYPFPVTEEMKVWIKLNGEAMEQGEFAAFLEEHAAELASPLEAEKSEYEHLFKERFSNPIELIQLSRHLEVFVGAKAKQGVRLQSGERTVEFSEEHMNGAGEKIDIPGIFMVSIRAFMDGETVRIPARLRYRIKGGAIQWFYQLYRWEFFLRERVQQDLDQAGEDTELPTFEGAPEA